MNIKSFSIITVRFKYFPSQHVHHLQHVVSCQHHLVCLQQARAR